MTPLLWFDVADADGWEGYDEPELRADSLTEDLDPYVPCPVCEGAVTEIGGEVCPNCKGTGIVHKLIEADKRADIIEKIDLMLEDESYKDNVLDII